MMTKPTPPRWLSWSYSCIPCVAGEHSGCRHKPDQGRLGQFSKPEPGTGCACEEYGHPIADTCRDWRSRDWTFVVCGKPAKGFATQRASHSPEGVETYEQPLCGIHLAGLRRSEENMAKWQAKWDESDRRRSAQAQIRRASADWAARLTDEFDIHASGHTASDAAEVLLVDVQPEHLYAVLSAASGMLRDVGIEWSQIMEEVAG